MLVFDSFGQIGTWRRWKCDPKLSWYESMMGQDQLCKKFRKCHHLGPRYDLFTKKISDLLLTRQSNIYYGCHQRSRDYGPKWSIHTSIIWVSPMRQYLQHMPSHSICFFICPGSSTLVTHVLLRAENIIRDEDSTAPPFKVHLNH